MITLADIEQATFEYVAHYNMGFVEHPDPKIDRHKGYGYGYRCVEFPRLGFIDRVYTLDDGGVTRTWRVDGADVADLTAAIVALNVPPILIEDEQRILARIPPEFTDLCELEDKLAVVPRPEGGIMPDTPHAHVMDRLQALRDKGMIEYGRRPLPACYDPILETEVDRWSPTIRRRDQDLTNQGCAAGRTDVAHLRRE
jgi:hypothetical protein